MKLNLIGILVLVLALVLTASGAAHAAESERVTLGVIDIAGAADVIERMFPGKYEVVAFPTMNEVLMALKSGRIEMAHILEDYAEFLMKSDDTVTYKRDEQVPAAPLTMLTRAGDTELTAAINEAIGTLKANGTLDDLHEKYVAQASPDDIPEAPAGQKFDGAREVIVGVSGDFPPHDYISVTGDPAGFNVALMHEIAALAGINVRFETVSFGSKFAALESERIDLFFLHAGFFAIDGITQTEAYDEGIYTGALILKQ